MLDSETGVSSADEPARGGLKITEDLPGTRLSLSWVGPRPWGWWRVVIPMIVLLIVAGLGSGRRGPFVLAWEQINQAAPRDTVADVFLGLITVGSLFFAWLGCSQLGQLFGYWSSLNFEGTEQLLTVERRGWGIFFGRKTTTVLFPRIQFLSLRASQKLRAPYMLALSISYRDRDDALQELSCEFPLKGCTRRGQALEFILAIGRIVGATGYMNGGGSPKSTSWSLMLPYTPPRSSSSADFDDDDDFDEEDDRDDLYRSEASAAPESAGNDLEDRIDVLPIPPLGETIEQEEEPVGATVAAVDWNLAEQVNVEQLNEKITTAKLTEWKPGQRVRIERERAPALVFWIVAIFGALVGGGIGGWPVYGFLDGLLGHGVIWWPGALVLSGVIGATVLTFMAWNNFQEQTVDIEWSEHSITMVDGGVKTQQPFENCRGLQLSRLTKTEYSGSDSNRTVSKVEHGCRLDLILTDRVVPLLKTETWESSAAAAQKVLQPLGKSLAQAMGLTCDWSDSSSADTDALRRALRFSFGQYVIFAALLMVAVVGIGRGITQRKLRVDAGQAVRNLGGEAVWMNGFSMKNKSVYKEFWKVEFENDAQIDEHLAHLQPALELVPELGIELGQCPLTDAGIAHLKGVSGLRVLTASNTRITDTGLASIGNCHELVYLNLFGNDLSDDGVQHLSKLTKMRFLFVGGTRMTDAGLQQIGKIKSLEYLQLSGSAVTPQGVQQLKAARPDLEIDFTER